ncbi:microcystin degradation protein MlrC [Cytobacillus oceanisediminis]|jgi:microcystin degradation protein MlrC|uniref:Microcystin degradation protein MlrC n=1 Tax=Cytobacillus oceanisediminis TaxID=665099 RepID=A0A2V3A0C3_9BACI|nr:M81 family metallopeptidase [Cytobacillus oceanisediminis]PWW29690.1 microcystin degradation protein MlrC [Cytobacillus oceanisediminis]
MMKTYRIGIAFFYHESHSFSPLKTEISDFENEGYFKGKQIVKAYKGTKTEVGGFLDQLSKEKDIEIVPLLCAAATPSGIVSKEAYMMIEEDMLNSIQQASHLDGMLLALHGAMVVEDMFDPEEVLMGKIKSELSPGTPIATTLDMHANLSEKMMGYTPYHFGFKTYPHTDMYEQGINAARILAEHLRGDASYYSAFRKLPMMPPSINMRTEEGPMKEMIDLAFKMESKEEIANVSVFGGFPYSDIPMAGASVHVIGRSKKAAEDTADFLAKQYWDIREEFIVKLPSAKEGLQLALSLNADKPIVLADISDNPLSCGSGDTTLLLREMIEANVPNSLFGALTDPQSIKACNKAGVNQMVQLNLGGKTSPEFGLPVPVMAKVIALSDGVFFNTGPMNEHLRVDVKGAAHIRVGEVDILLIGRPMSANDPQLFRHIGIEPKNKKILGLKAKNHFRAAFDPLVSKVIYVDAPGVSSNNLLNFNYRNIPENMWPLKSPTYSLH